MGCECGTLPNYRMQAVVVGLAVQSSRDGRSPAALDAERYTTCSKGTD